MKDNDLKALGLVGLGLLGLSAWSRAEARTEFNEELSTRLQALGFEVASSSFGRGPNMIGLWAVFVRTPQGAKRTIIRIPKDLEPYSKEALQAVLTHFQGMLNEAAG